LRTTILLSEVFENWRLFLKLRFVNTLSPDQQLIFFKKIVENLFYFQIFFMVEKFIIWSGDFLIVMFSWETNKWDKIKRKINNSFYFFALLLKFFENRSKVKFIKMIFFTVSFLMSDEKQKN
jgi:hypothetical protein